MSESRWSEEIGVVKPAEFYDGNDDHAHGKFQQGRRQQYENGCFIKYKGPSDTMLDRSSCPHLGNADWDRPEEGFGAGLGARKLATPKSEH
jgi:hypothetical protein